MVIGAGLGGLSAAIHARLRRFEVLVIEQQAVVGGKAQGIEQAGYALDPGPSIIIMPEIYEAVFRAAGEDMANWLEFMPLETVSRVFFGEDVTLDIPANRAGALEVLRGLSSNDAESLDRLLTRVEQVEPLLHSTIYAKPFTKPWHLMNPNLLKFGMKFNAVKPYRQMVDEMFEHPLVRSFFYGFPSYGGQSYDSIAPGAFFIPYYMLCRGVYAVRGGVRAIPLAFRGLAEKLGVDFRLGTRVTGLQTTGSRVTGVELGSEEVACEAVISNMDRFSLAQMLGRTVPAEPNFSYFTMHVGLRRQVDWLEHHNLFVPQSFEQGFADLYERNEFPAEPIVYVNATRKMDPDAAPPGCENLFMVVTVPADVAALDYQHRSDEYAQRVRNVLAKRGLQWTDDELDFCRIQTPTTFAQRDGSYMGSLYGLAERYRLWKMFPETNIDPEYSNLRHCGGSVQPGAGMPMVTLSGKFAAESLR